MTGQQQGREVAASQAECLIAEGLHAQGARTWAQALEDARLILASSAPPARDSGRDEARERDTQVDKTVPLDEAREAAARWLIERDGYVYQVIPSRYEQQADGLLSLPEVRRLLDGAR